MMLLASSLRRGFLLNHRHHKNNNNIIYKRIFEKGSGNTVTFYCRPFSTGSSNSNHPSPPTSTDHDQEPSSSVDTVVVHPEIVLYERRTPSNHDWLMKSGLLFSTFHTSYWIWYAFDFIPLINSGPYPEFHMDPLWGYGGILFGLFVNGVFLIYPKRLLSKLTYRQADDKLLVYTHQLPFCRRDVFPSASFPVGTHVPGRHRRHQHSKDNDDKIQYFKINTSSEMGKHLVEELGDLRKYRYGLPVGPPSRFQKYIMNIGSPADVVEPELLMEILVHPEYFELEEQQDEYRPRQRERGWKWKAPSKQKPRRQRRRR